MSIIPIIVSVGAILVIFAVIGLVFFCCRCWLPRHSLKAEDLKRKLVPKEKDEEALSLPTMPDLPTTPMRIYDPNDPSTFPEHQGIFGQYQGTENAPMVANTQVLTLSWPQGFQVHSSSPTYPEPRYDQNSGSVPQDSSEQSEGAGNTLGRTDTQVSQAQGHGDLPTSPGPQGELYSPSVNPVVIGLPPTLPKPQDGPYSPNVPPRVIFGQRARHGAGNTPHNILPGGTRPQGYKGLPTV